jgi:hypothetical protein
MTTKGEGLLEKYFYFGMSLLITGVVIYGFSHTVGENLIHPTIPRPWILYVHAAVFSVWLVFFILQSTLVRTNHVQIHRKMGWFGVGLGATIPVLGISTAITMGRFNAVQLHYANSAVDLIIPFFDIVAFTIAFSLAIYWRRKPEYHRRLMLIATCALTAAGFGRFPEKVLPSVIFYSGVDLLILLGLLRDVIVNRRVHPVYRYALPALLIGQTIVMYTNIHKLPYWMKIANALLG